MLNQETGGTATLQNIESAGSVMPLARFLKSAERKGRLSRRERLRIVDQTLLLLEMNYVHLPLKQAMHAINPIQRLKLLKYRLETKASEMEPVMQFHQRLLEIFASLRDVHTSYFLPTPFTVGGEELTVSLKLRRKVIQAKYAALLEAAYQEAGGQEGCGE